MALAAVASRQLAIPRGSQGAVNPQHHWRLLHTRSKNASAQGLSDLAKGDTRIAITDSDLGNSGAMLLAQALAAQSNLQNLNLAGNRICDEGAIHLALALHRHSKLQVLCLSYNKLGNLAAGEIARILENHPYIMRVNLDGNNITDIGANDLLGALATNPRGSDICVALTNNPIKRFGSKSLQNLGRAASTVKTLSLRGVTLGQLMKLYATGCANGTIEPETTTTSDVALDIVLPASAPNRTSWVEAFGSSNPAPATFVVHAWNGLFRDLLRAIASHATRDPNPSLDLNDPLWVFDAFGYKDRSYFVDVFTVNQHATLNKYRSYGLADTSCFEVGDSNCQIDKFKQVAEQIQKRDGRVLIVVDYDNLALSRIQCLKEVYQAIHADTSKLDVSFSRLPSFPYDKMFTPCQRCQASCNKDRDMILEEIESDHGGFEQFDKEIVDFMTDAIVSKYQEKIQSLMPKDYTNIKKNAAE
eukprot:CAMPEP_0169229642 /NCGR_PEP_ID=MMETSP1016-20121227/25495_1 /TAXON_ID=342587 /ORGANISM="Karlodinium micrum, Strain CCMP2283" /LENGTH=472 /DNA_ID=CAMNT_0009308539 /DNA_START=43 /DNA_END=1461 /DNA_ORIENTATION=+